ncbi:MAG: hypothetical protein JNM07_08345 [Phycisphaerae bacterium]|nr:hypothetical protein [Phycisphaerae bacterium]
MAISRSSKNNLLAGSFLLVSLIGGVVITLVLANVEEWSVKTEAYVIRFTLSDGISGIKPGSIVKLGGQPIGKVTGVQLGVDEETKRECWDVAVRLRSALAVTIHEDAMVYLELPLLGSVSAINISDPGSGDVPEGRRQGADARLGPGERLTGRLAPPTFLAQAGYGPKQIAEVQKFIANTSKASERFDPITGEAQKLLSDAREVVGSVRERTPDWSERISRFLTRLDEASDDFKPLTKAANEAMATANEVVDRVRAVIDENRENVRATLANATDISQRIRDEVVPRVVEFLDKGKGGIDTFNDALARADNLLKEAGPEFRIILANGRLASDQLKLAMTEIRRNPWRLLYQPGKKELEKELLYDSARTYAQAVSDLRATAASLEAIVAMGPGAQTLDHESAERLTRSLEETFRKYKDSERDFLDRLVNSPR